MKKAILLPSRQELLLVFILSLSASFLSLLPTLWAYLKTPPGLWFVGFHFLYQPWDINVYLAAMRQGFEGHWGFLNTFDTTVTTPLPIYLPYLVFGHLARLFSLSVPLTYHLASVFLTIFLFFILYFFLAFFIKEKNWRLLVMILIVFGGGLTWLFFPKHALLDIRLVGGTFFQTLFVPHLVLNQILFLATLLFSFWAVYFRKWRFTLLGILSGIFLASIHPYSLAVVIFVSLGYFLILILARKNLTGIVYLFPPWFFWGLSLAFFYFLLKSNPLFTQEDAFIYPWEFFLSYGLLSPLAIYQAVSFWREKEEKSLFLLSWLIFQFLFLYLPLPFWPGVGVKGYFIILGISAILGLKKLAGKINFSRLVYFLVFISSFLTQVFITVSLFSPFYLFDGWTYLSRQEKEAFDFLLKSSKERKIVLSSYRSGSFLQSNTNSRVYLAHEMVFNFPEKKKNASDFFSGQLSSPSQFLKKEKIDYVFWGPQEKSLGDFDLTSEPYLENIYQNEKVTLFKVK